MDDVIQFLLGQIALNGDLGAHTSEVFRFLTSYSKQLEIPSFSEAEGFPGVAFNSPASTLLNSASESTIWSWLLQHKGLLVGKTGQANHWTFEQVRAHNDAAIATCRAHHENEAVSGEVDSNLSLHCMKSTDSPILKLYASEEHVWHAITGHGIDRSRVPPRDFDCLCIIAQHRESGIDQPTLVKLTGQDSRSVPTRTQRLCDAGYVVKIPTMIHGTRTSLLILKKLSSWIHLEPTEETDPLDKIDSTTPLTLARPSRSKYTEHESKIREALKILAGVELITWDDLKRKLGIFDDVRQAKALATAFRDLETPGIVQRVRAQGTQDTENWRYHRCVKLLREPNANDFKKFFSLNGLTEKTTPNPDSSLGDIAALDVVNRDSHSHPNTTEHHFITSNNSDPTTAFQHELSWDSNRQLTHIVRDVIDAAGSEGATLQDIKERATGTLYDRPIEHLLGRLVEYPHTSQPSHLKHLGIIRDVTVIGRSNVYIHYASHRLEALLRSERISRDAGFEETSKETSRADSLDAFGFLPVDKTAFKLQSGAGSLSLCASFSSQLAAAKSESKPKSNPSTPKRPRGRPRKDGRPPGSANRDTAGGQTVPPQASPTPNSREPEEERMEDATIVLDSNTKGPHSTRVKTKPPQKSEVSVHNDSGLTHHEQLMLIHRPSTGIFIGELYALKRPGLRGRRPKTRLAIIKTPRLADFPWFTEVPTRQFDSSELSRRDRVTQDPEFPTVMEANTAGAGETATVSGTQRISGHSEARFPAGSSLIEAATSHEIQPESHATTVCIPPNGIKDRLRAPLNNSEPQNTSRIPLGGGSAAARRRQVILNILDAGGGLYPGGNELWYPFVTTWQKSHSGSQPDMRTIKNAVSALIDSGKIRRVMFNFQNKHGNVVVKSILTLISIQPDDVCVKELQEGMIAADPRLYLPESVHISPELRPNIKKPDVTPSSVPTEEKKVDLHYIPVYLRKRKASLSASDDIVRPRKTRRRSKLNAPARTDTGGISSPEISNATRSYSTYQGNGINNQISPLSESSIPTVGGLGATSQIGEELSFSPYSKEDDNRVNNAFGGFHEPLVEGEEEDEDDDYYEESRTRITRKKRARPSLGPKLRKLASLTDKTRKLQAPPIGSKEVIKRTRTREPLLGDVSEGWELRVYVAVVLVKILTGGLEEVVDWDLVASMLDSRTKATRIKTKWNHLRSMFKKTGVAILDELREKLAGGFEDGSLATIDYNNIWSYDWRGLLDWAMASLDAQRSESGLPRTRASLDERFEVVTAPAATLATFYDDNLAATIQGRRAILHKHAYAEDLTPTPSKAKSERAVLARSWVHAIMTTPETDYNADVAAVKLSFFTDSELSATIKQLRSDRVITPENKGRLVPGRGFDFSDKYTSRLKDSLEVAQLLEASKFKGILDSQLSQSRTATFDPNSSDGAYLALVNMVGYGQVKTDNDMALPTSSSLVESGYMTRKMNKSRLIFTVNIEPTEEKGSADTVKYPRYYVKGNPLNVNIEPPRCPPTFTGSGANRIETTKIPMWYDMNGNLVPIMWRVARAMVAMHLNTRPGITLDLLGEVLKPSLQLFEIELLWQWMVDAGAAAYANGQRSHIVLGEWWWMILNDAVE